MNNVKNKGKLVKVKQYDIRLIDLVKDEQPRFEQSKRGAFQIQRSQSPPFMNVNGYQTPSYRNITFIRNNSNEPVEYQKLNQISKQQLKIRSNSPQESFTQQNDIYVKKYMISDGLTANGRQKSSSQVNRYAQTQDYVNLQKIQQIKLVTQPKLKFNLKYDKMDRKITQIVQNAQENVILNTQKQSFRNINFNNITNNYFNINIIGNQQFNDIKVLNQNVYQKGQKKQEQFQYQTNEDNSPNYFENKQQTSFTNQNIQQPNIDKKVKFQRVQYQQNIQKEQFDQGSNESFVISQQQEILIANEIRNQQLEQELQRLRLETKQYENGMELKELQSSKSSITNMQDNLKDNDNMTQVNQQNQENNNAQIIENKFNNVNKMQISKTLNYYESIKDNKKQIFHHEISTKQKKILSMLDKQITIQEQFQPQNEFYFNMLFM